MLVAERVTAQEVGGAHRARPRWSELQNWFQGLFEERRDTLVAEELLRLSRLSRARGPARRARRERPRGRWMSASSIARPRIDAAHVAAARRAAVLRGRLLSGERRAIRVVKPIADRLGAGRLVAPDEVFAAFERLYGEVEDVPQILLDTDRTSARLVVNPAVSSGGSARAFPYSVVSTASPPTRFSSNRVLPEQAAHGYLALGRARAPSSSRRSPARFPSRSALAVAARRADPVSRCPG